jgi:hypothetical protein
MFLLLGLWRLLLFCFLTWALILGVASRAVPLIHGLLCLFHPLFRPCVSGFSYALLILVFSLSSLILLVDLDVARVALLLLLSPCLELQRSREGAGVCLEKDSTEIREIPIYFEDNPKRVLERLSLKAGYYIIDIADRRFPDNDALFTHSSRNKEPAPCELYKASL